jgi:hypothetical protein
VVESRDENTVLPSSETLELVRRRSAVAKQALHAAERLRRLVEATAEAMPDRPAMTITLITAESDLLGALPDEDPVRGEMQALGSRARTQAVEAAAGAVRRLPEALESFGLSIDSSSRHPRYSIDDRLIEIEVKQAALSVTITPRHGSTVKEPLDIAAVAGRIAAERDRLLSRPFDRGAFLAALTAALEGGEPVPVRDLAKAVAPKGRPKLDEFAVDLGKLLRSKELEAHAMRLIVNHTRDTENGLLLHGLERGGFVGSVHMREMRS